MPAPCLLSAGGNNAQLPDCLPTILPAQLSLLTVLTARCTALLATRGGATQQAEEVIGLITIEDVLEELLQVHCCCRRH